jgi:MIP family channel proteins
MDTTLRRGFVAEMLGTFAVVYFAAGAVCVNYLTTTGQQPGSSALHALQPGLAGVALAQGLIVAAALAVTVRLSGGFLNPAITLMLWVFNRLDNKRTAYFLLAQLAGAVLAGAILRLTFEDAVLRQARLGTPHLNPQAFEKVETASILAGTGIELVLTFFLVFAIFGADRNAGDPSWAALPAGLVLVAGSVVALPLTGAAANPARWFGTVLWEQLLPERAVSPWADTFVYLAGPILGALAAGLVTFRFLLDDASPALQPVKQPVAAKKK